MNQHSIRTPALRRNILAGLFPLLAGGVAAAAPTALPAAAATSGAPCACHGTVYSVINLDPEGGAAAFLNEKGKAAVGSFVFGTNSFFDGDFVRPIGDLGGGPTFIEGLNDRGVVIGESRDSTPPFGTPYAFTWTLARGMRALPGSLGGQVFDINNRNQIVGLLPVGPIPRAVRWDPSGAIVPLGPLPFSLSEARAINEFALAGGFTDYADGTIHASLWNPAGALIDLGTLGGQRAFTREVNARGEAAGFADDPTNTNVIGFFWSPVFGRVPIGSQNGGARLIADLNDRGEVVGLTGGPGATTAYHWSRARGLEPLPRAGAPESDVFDINNRSEMVGGLLKAGGWRATLWRGLTAPVDLNSRLHRIPAGLVLERGAAINESGTILAYSNAGLVMLRPGKRGTDAPVLGPVTGLPAIVALGDAVTPSLSFIDNAPAQVHTAVVDWGDSCTSPLPLVVEAGGAGTVNLQHTFCSPGFQNVVVRVTDSGGRTTETQRQVLVDAPALGAVSGRGTLAGAPADAAARALPLQFALWVPLSKEKAAAAGVKAEKAGVALQGPFAFRSDSVAVVARNGAQVRLEGSGRYNGRADYRFVVDALDGGAAQGSADRMRVRISHRDAAGKDVVDYDSATRAKAGIAAAASAGDGLSAVDGVLTLGN
jgi:hypothetical protein